MFLIIGTRIMSLNSPQIHSSATMESNWVKHLPFNYIGRHNLYQESLSSPTVTNHVGSNHFRFIECEQPLATTTTNRAFSLLSSPPPLSQQTMVTMEPVPCGLDHYTSVQEIDNKYAFCESNRLEANFMNLAGN